MELHLKIIGVLLMLLALLHVIFPKYFKWKDELSLVSHVNRQMMYVHAFFIALIVFLIGLLCLTSASELITTHIGQRISLGLGIFWATRLYFQFFVYSRILWKGKKFETAVHILFAGFWAYLSVIFFGIYLG
jgi:hypothetical protein